LPRQHQRGARDRTRCQKLPSGEPHVDSPILTGR
jgi:hypothetical protein